MADANTKRDSHIFPIYLKGQAVELGNSDDGDLPVDTSFINFNITAGGANPFKLVDGTIPGQIIVLHAQAASSTHMANITVESALGVGLDLDNFQLQAAGESVTLIWNGEAWAPIASNAAVKS